jgi:hypothetical protein
VVWGKSGTGNRSVGENRAFSFQERIGKDEAITRRHNGILPDRPGYSMGLTVKQDRFLRGRRALNRYARLLLVVVGIGYAGFVVWLLVRSPLLVNPFEVMRRMEAGTLDASMQALMAALLPIVLSLSLVIAAAFLLCVLATLGLEKRYQEIIETLSRID